MGNNSVYAIEFLRPDGIYSVDLAQRLLTADEYIVLEKKRQEEYRRQHPAWQPLSDAEQSVLIEAGFSLERPDLADLSSWNGWTFYENLDGQHLAVPPGVTPTVTKIGREAIPEYLESRRERLEDSLEQLGELYERYSNKEDNY